MITSQQANEINKRAYAGTEQATKSLKAIEQKRTRLTQQEEILQRIALKYY